MKIISLMFLFLVSTISYSQTKFNQDQTRDDLSRPKVTLETNIPTSTLYAKLKNQYEFIMHNTNEKPLITRDILLLIMENQKDEETLIRLNSTISIRIYPRPS